MAGTLSRTEGKVRLYVNGRVEASGDFARGTAPDDFADATWKVGIANPGAAQWRFCANARIDDVRIYSRVLPEAEIAELARPPR